MNGLLPTALAGLTDDLGKVGTRSGMVFSVISFACLSGTPLAGALIHGDGKEGEGRGAFWGMQMFAGGVMMAGAVVLGMARGARVGWRIGWGVRV